MPTKPHTPIRPRLARRLVEALRASTHVANGTSSKFQVPRGRFYGSGVCDTECDTECHQRNNLVGAHESYFSCFSMFERAGYYL